MSKIDLEQFARFTDMYEFVDELYDENSTIPIRLTDDDFHGTIIRYDKIDMTSMNMESNEATLRFNYEFIENPHDIGKHNARFHNHLGDLLVNIIINTLNGKEDENRDDDSEQSDSQRGLQSEGSTVSE
jgi:hypothetical protein